MLVCLIDNGALHVGDAAAEVVDVFVVEEYEVTVRVTRVVLFAPVRTVVEAVRVLNGVG